MLWDEYKNKPDTSAKDKDAKDAKRVVDHYIYLLETGDESIGGINSQITKQFEELCDDDVIIEAVITRNWRVYDYLCSNSRLFNFSSEDFDQFEGPEKEEAPEADE